MFKLTRPTNPTSYPEPLLCWRRSVWVIMDTRKARREVRLGISNTNWGKPASGEWNSDSVRFTCRQPEITFGLLVDISIFKQIIFASFVYKFLPIFS